MRSSTKKMAGKERNLPGNEQKLEENKRKLAGNKINLAGKKSENWREKEQKSAGNELCWALKIKNKITDSFKIE